jgi:hypothetical protein
MPEITVKKPGLKGPNEKIISLIIEMKQLSHQFMHASMLGILRFAQPTLSSPRIPTQRRNSLKA